MARIRTLATTLPLTAPLELARSAIVVGCALALALAGRPLPF